MVSSILVIAVSLLFSAFFSGMEIAFISANRLRIELEKQKGSVSASHVHFFQQHPREYIATMLVGNNVALVIYGLFMGAAMKPYFESYIDSEIGTTLIQTLISTIVILLTAEYLPKTIFRNHPNTALHVFALPVRFFYIFFYPITRITVFISDSLLTGLLKVKINEEQEQRVFGKIDLDNLLTESQADNTEEQDVVQEVKLFQNVLEFSDTLVRESMIPRNEIEAIEVNSPIGDLEQLFAHTGYSRIPVFEDSIDNIIGYVHHLQMFDRPQDIRTLIKGISIVPSTMSVKTLLTKLLAEQQSISVVVDEFGGTAGLITTEDILEEIFGEIEDEHDQTELHEEQIGENEFVFSGRQEIDYLNEKYSLRLPEVDDFETLAGFVLYRHESIPDEGKKIEIDQYSIEILKLEGPRIELIKIKVED